MHQQGEHTMVLQQLGAALGLAVRCLQAAAAASKLPHQLAVRVVEVVKVEKVLVEMLRFTKTLTFVAFMIGLSSCYCLGYSFEYPNNQTKGIKIESGPPPGQNP